MRKALIFVVLSLALNLIWSGQEVQAEEPAGYLKVTTGMSATTANWQAGKVEETFDAQALRKAWGNLAVGYKYGRFEAEGQNVSDHAVQGYYFLRDPQKTATTKKANLYFLFAPTFITGLPDSVKKGDLSGAFGVGVLLPNWDAAWGVNFLFEVTARVVNETVVVGLGFGTQMGLKP